MTAWFLVFDGCPYAFGTEGVTNASLSSWPPDVDPNVTILPGVLDRPTGELNERLRPTEGDCDVSPLSFVLHDIAAAGYDRIITRLFTTDRGASQADGFVSETALPGDATLAITLNTALPSLPCYAWVNRECVMIVSASATPGRYNVTRARFGTVARTIVVNADDGIIPELSFTYPGATRSRCTLYRVTEQT